ncbi:MAG: RdgB/HAM1 family non-canonical purine NTP pyrophosphatase [Oscillospiraceae bacterium]|nr:RdgB/HAM1 family non-canonical purine NTP pyrophosphatase [Oscillospiraceae bacterium]MDD4413265.1 RdgB/HAM1 family non-canonical purine NTP pyrophosphatase [Oscillospiraceae bacterium]
MRFIVATRNYKKLKELSRILKPLGIDAVTDAEIGIKLDEVEENGTSFEENAVIKAESACKQSGLPAIADDSGLEVDALGGEPGVHSARYAGENATDADRNLKLLAAMASVPEDKRTARFISAICCVFPNGDKVMARGECDGQIGYEPVGENGFGYDPLFIVSSGHSFAELSTEDKDIISHRGNALRLFAVKLQSYLEGHTPGCMER